MAPPALRDFIFRREMPLVCLSISRSRLLLRMALPTRSVTMQVLNTILFGDAALFRQEQRLRQSAVFVHLSSHVKVPAAFESLTSMGQRHGLKVELIGTQHSRGVGRAGAANFMAPVRLGQLGSQDAHTDAIAPASQPLDEGRAEEWHCGSGAGGCGRAAWEWRS